MTRPETMMTTGPIPGVSTVGFIGAGTMGCFNALTAARCGYDAIVYDSIPDKLATFKERLRKMSGSSLLKRYGIDLRIADKDLDRIQVAKDLGQVVDRAQLISESVFERIAVKRCVLQQLDRLCPPDTIITTNTSSIPLEELESALERSDRFAALHSHLYSILFDIGVGRETAPDVVDILKQYVHSLGGHPVMVRHGETGYCYNTMIGGLFAAAIILSVDFGIDCHDIDRAWMKGADYLGGPFGMMDAVGLNIIHDSASEVAVTDPFQKGMIERKERLFSLYIPGNALGTKSGRGFYDYPNPEYLNPGFTDSGIFCVEAYKGLLLGLVCMATAMVTSRGITPFEADRVWMLGQNVNIGPFGLLDKLGLDLCMEMLDQKEVIEALPSWSPVQIAELLEPYLSRKEFGVASGKGFYRYPMPEYQAEGFVFRTPSINVVK